MKKVLIFGLVFVLLFSLFGCAAEEDPRQWKRREQQEDVQPKEEEEKPEPPKQEKAPEKETIAETVLIEDKGIRITAKSLDKDSIFGPELKILIENNSDTNVIVQTRDTSVNGYMVSSMISADVAAGKKANDEITFSSSDMERCGIETIADIEVSFYIFTSDGWDTYLDTPPIRIETTVAASYEYAFDDSGLEMYQGNGIRIVGKGIAHDSIFGPSMVLFIENTSEQPITVQSRDTSVNGFMVSAMISENVLPGKRAMADVNFLDLEDNEIEEIEDIEISFHVFNSDNWDTIVDTEAISVSVNK